MLFSIFLVLFIFSLVDVPRFIDQLNLTSFVYIYSVTVVCICLLAYIVAVDNLLALRFCANFCGRPIFLFQLALLQPQSWYFCVCSCSQTIKLKGAKIVYFSASMYTKFMGGSQAEQDFNHELLLFRIWCLFSHQELVRQIRYKQTWKRDKL